MASRSLTDLTPKARALEVEFHKRMTAIGLSYVITCTRRTPEEQMALWYQGRATLNSTNNFRATVGLPPITQEENLKRVTWTMNSRHFPDANHKARAFDIAITKGTIPSWDIKIDVNHDSISDYEEAARIGREVGLRCGADFSTKDWVHFEAPEE